MGLEWDEQKNQANIRKHGISFEIAKRIFDQPMLTRSDQRQNYGETRYVSIGQLEDAVSIVVAHTHRNGRIRLISARPASRKERERFHERIR